MSGLRVLVGMSGGVDSAVAALLLQRAGYEVVGATLRTWQSEDGSESLCCDIVVIKPATGEVHTFRLGAGGAAMDYLFKY